MVAAGKIAFVTGGAKRVGKAIALALAKRGCHVAINYRSSSKEARGTVDELQKFGVTATAIRGDVSRKADVIRMAAEIRKKLGPVDILVNNASIYERTPWPKISKHDWDQHLDINLRGPFLCAQVFGPKMAKRKRGKIINLVDWAGERPYRGYLPYAVSKAGLICLTKILAKELAPYVQVNAIGPGPVLPPEKMTAGEKRQIVRTVPLRKIGSPSDVANTVLFLVEGTDFATGATFYIDGGRIIE